MAEERIQAGWPDDDVQTRRRGARQTKSRLPSLSPDEQAARWNPRAVSDRHLDTRLINQITTRSAWSIARAGALLIMAPVLLLSDLPYRGVMAVILLFGASVQWFIGRRPGRSSATWQMGTLDVFLCTCGLVLAPDLWPAICLWMGCVLTWVAFMTPTRISVPLHLGAVFVGPAVASFHELDFWWVFTLTQAILSAAYIYYGYRLRRGLVDTELELLGTVAVSGAVIQRVEITSDPRILTAQGDIEGLTGYSPSEWIGSRVLSHLHPKDAETNWLHPDDLQPGELLDRIARWKHASGRWVWIRELSRVVLDANGEREVRGYLLDVTEAEEAQIALFDQARTDGLTALPNRVAHEEELGRLLDSGLRVGVILLDLDRFKDLNDTLGHPAGDEALKRIATRLRASSDPGVHIARLGGDEFALIIPGVLDDATMRPYLDHVIAACTRPLTIGSVEIALGVSAGIVYSEPGNTVDVMMRHADLAMYRAKHLSRSSFTFDRTLLDESSVSLALTGAVSAAIDTDDIELWFQPQIDLETGVMLGAEGLARWQHPEFGFLSPGEFLPVIRFSEHADAFQIRMVTKALAAIQASIDRGLPMRMAVNLWIRSLFDLEFTEQVLSIVEESGVPPHLLVIEFTEHDSAPVNEAFSESLRRFTECGVLLSIDDFGTGYSSLQRLASFAVDELKIDRSFTAALGNARSHVLAETIVDMAHRLDLHVVAEGVETAEQAEILRDLGCHAAQGYHFAKALPLDEFFALVESSSAPAT